ncbi:hypothetical protein O6072_15915 [Mycolicibacterium neoaurum]|uniref:hypothetical protein n=1 Tax=Mycolicibacterium neoaurum TaxID=1795 RepID=UPI00248AC71A|nr:hypothetical protein [Mycolicibacterium neoaurum]WBP92803.1 hypothetical protein O7W24_16595 [Mycolicibacterium neoaurum]WBS06365.1 hypothetical protein O6072_15915 [Mycolicibacterium neoaurum]
MTTPTRYETLLRSHIGFLERSAQRYDAGHEDESLNVSNSLRTIFHDTRRTTSLLTHLKLDKTDMLSSSRGHGDAQDYLCHLIHLGGPRPIIMKPLLGTSFIEIPLTRWWDGEPVFVHDGVPYTRRNIVLSVAEKDGGTHVDEELEPYYRVLIAGEYAIGITGNLTYDGPAPFPQGVTIYPDNAHLALIRQFAHEVLRSAERFAWPTAP